MSCTCSSGSSSCYTLTLYVVMMPSLISTYRLRHLLRYLVMVVVTVMMMICMGLCNGGGDDDDDDNNNDMYGIM